MLAKRFIIAVGLPALLVAACGNTVTSNLNITQGSGKIVTESRDVSGFQAVELTNSGSLVIEQGEAEALTIETDDNILPLLTSDVQNGKLTLGTKPGSSFNTRQGIIFRVTVKDLNALTLTSSGDAELDRLETAALTIVVSGSGDLRLGTINVENDLSITLSSAGDVTAERVESDNLNLTSSGSGSADLKAVSAGKIVARLFSAGNVTLAGTADEQDIEVSGSGNYDAHNLESATVKAVTSSAGDIRVKVSDRLDATVSGSGSIFYSGSPQVTANDTSAGSITQQ
jgi:hypothetical protein